MWIGSDFVDPIPEIENAFAGNDVSEWIFARHPHVAAVGPRHSQRTAVIWDHATATKNLPHHHGNPFDRVIIAQAQLENCSLITRNAKMSQYDIHIISA